MKFYCVDHNVPDETITILSEACVIRDIEFVAVDTANFDFEPVNRARVGDLLFRPAVSLDATRVEQFLHANGVATFYRDPNGVFFNCSNNPLCHQRTGLPVPRFYYCATANRNTLRSHVENLGGFPVIIKIMGFSRGVGVMRVESMPSLFSLVDFAIAQGFSPVLAAYVEDAVHWRVVVVGEQAVACYRNPTDSDDFRTYGSQDPEDFFTDVSENLAQLAVTAISVLRLEFGGVDILEHASGRLYLLEANFPCYFAQPQTVAGIDVAGAMVDYLVHKSSKIQANS